ncbi:MAG TPA: c-type cytochrome [Gemmatimonadales bacterium]|jgi:cbb3-type cytochrome c oxidase subunit III
MDLRIRLGLVVAMVSLVGSGQLAAQEKAAGPAAVTPAAIAKGDSIFHKSGLCYACHGTNAKGAVGPNLTDAEWLHSDGSYDGIVATVTSGVPPEKAKKGVAMPPKGGSSISDEEVKAVAAYVYSLSHK